MVQKRRTPFDPVRHLAPVAETREEQGLEVGFAEEVAGRVERVPLRGHFRVDGWSDGFGVEGCGGWGVVRGEGGVDGEEGIGGGHLGWGGG